MSAALQLLASLRPIYRGTLWWCPSCLGWVCPAEHTNLRPMRARPRLRAPCTSGIQHAGHRREKKQVALHCEDCSAEIGEPLVVGARVKVRQRRYARGVLGPRPHAWFAARVAKVEFVVGGRFLTLATARRGTVRAFDTTVLPISAPRAEVA